MPNKANIPVQEYKNRDVKKAIYSMDKSLLKELTSENYNYHSNMTPFSYDALFEIINFNEDVEVCKKARLQLYKLIGIDFLKNYLRDDFFDKGKNDSFEIFKFLKDYLEEENEYVDLLKEHLTSKSSEDSIQKAWDFINTNELKLEELASIISHSVNKSVQEEAWDIYIDKVQYSLEDKRNDEEDNAIESLFSICFSCKNEIFVSESWRLLKQFEFFNTTYLELILESPNPEIIEYAWKHLNMAELKDNELIQIIKETSSKKVAHEALDIFRHQKH